MDKTLVQVRLPDDLVKRLDHARIDLELTRASLLERIIHAWLKERVEATPPADGQRCGEGEET